MTARPRWPADPGDPPGEEREALPPPPGQMGVVQTALLIGLLLMGIQLWLLTVALELYLAGEGAHVWQLALLSGGVFLGGLAILWLLARRPRVRRVTPTETGLATLLRQRGRRS